MRLIVGLGNPGKKYQKTRHNIGFIVLDNFFSKNDKQFKKQKNYDSVEYKGVISIKPKTFMNLSGKAVRYWLEKEKCPDRSLRDFLKSRKNRLP